jgi:hypothetical protein
VVRGGREHEATISGTEVDHHPRVAGGELRESADVHLRQASSHDSTHAYRLKPPGSVRS